jgi:hypothetical protein
MRLIRIFRRIRSISKFCLLTISVEAILEEKRTEESKMNSYDLNMNKKPPVGNDQKEKELKEQKEKELREKELREKELKEKNALMNMGNNKVDPRIVNPYVPYNVQKKPEMGGMPHQRPASANVVDNRPKTPVLQNNYNNYINRGASPLNNYQRNIQVAQHQVKNPVPVPNLKPVPIQQAKPISSRPQSAKNEIKPILYNKPASPKPNAYGAYDNRSPIRKDVSPLRNNVVNNPIVRPSSGQPDRKVIEKINYIGGQQKLVGNVIPRAGINNPVHRPVIGGNPINKPLTPVNKGNVYVAGGNKAVPSYGGPKIVYVKK